MKTSKYNTYLKLDRGSAITNGLLGTIDLCDDDAAKALKNGDLSSFSEDRLKILEERGYITESPDEKERLAEVADRIDRQKTNNTTLTLIPSYNCNFRCSYCFEKWRLENGPDWLKAVMTTDLVDSIFKIMDQKPFGSVVDCVHLFGGEPFLPQNKKIVEYILKKADERSIKNIYVVTNGYYLDKFIDLCVQYGVHHLQITIDGVKEEHDKRRFLASGAGSYDRIMDNIGLALSKKLPIVVRMNVNSDNADQQEELRKEFESRGWLSCSNFSFYCANIYYMKEEFENRVQNNSNYCNKIRKVLQSGEKIPLINTFCYAQKPAWVVDPFGDVYFCNEIVGKRENTFAHISEQGLEIDLNRFLDCQQRTVDKIDGCKDCPILFYCGGGCMSVGHTGQGDTECAKYFEAPSQIKKALHDELNRYLELEWKEKKLPKEYLIPLTKSYLAE